MKIAYLYYDLLNIYGESGNIKMIDKILTENKIKHEILYLSLDDDFKFNEYDLVYIGSGTENNQMIALNHLMKYRDDIKRYIENKKFFLVTGNSVDLFGKYIKGNKKTKCLSIFNYYVETGTRKMQDVHIVCDILLNDIYGFINNCCYIKNNTNPLFDKESIKYKNFYGTYVLGPILVRNPQFCQSFMDSFANKKLTYDFENEEKAYERFKIRFENGGTKQ